MIVREYPEAGPVAIWPAEASADHTAIALAVGGILTARRKSTTTPPVVCAVRPPMRRDRPTHRHCVRAEHDGKRLDLIVWELPRRHRHPRAAPIGR
jgi:hypothetical protein